jgi:hypothetical protein
MVINMKIRTIYTKLLFIISFALPVSQASALVLNSWNDTDLDASGDYVSVTFGTLSGNSWFSMQWGAGADNGLQALGLDTVFYNCTACGEFSTQKGDDTGTLGSVVQVFTGATAGAQTTDITADWSTNFGGTEGGGGFGVFTSRKSLDGGGTDGISNFLTFLLNGDVLPFSTNSNGATMDVHVRYEENCSGWASDGSSSSSSSGSCGGSVPEPTPLLLVSLGLIAIGIGRSRICKSLRS